jgi:hypothetical protein
MANNCPRWNLGLCEAPGQSGHIPCSYDKKDYSACAVLSMAEAMAQGASMSQALDLGSRGNERRKPTGRKPRPTDDRQVNAGRGEGSAGPAEGETHSGVSLQRSAGSQATQRSDTPLERRPVIALWRKRVVWLLWANWVALLGLFAGMVAMVSATSQGQGQPSGSEMGFVLVPTALVWLLFPLSVWAMLGLKKALGHGLVLPCILAPLMLIQIISLILLHSAKSDADTALALGGVRESEDTGSPICSAPEQNTIDVTDMNSERASEEAIATTDLAAVVFFPDEQRGMQYVRAIPRDTIQKIAGRAIDVGPTDKGRYMVKFEGCFTGQEAADLIQMAKDCGSLQGSTWGVGNPRIAHLLPE